MDSYPMELGRSKAPVAVQFLPMELCLTRNGYELYLLFDALTRFLLSFASHLVPVYSAAR